jgi:hypothetical protein
MPRHEHVVVLADHQAQELARLLDSLHLWLSEAPQRTLVELADHTDPCWTNTPGSREAYAAGFIAHLTRCRELLNTDKEDTHRTLTVTGTPTRGVSFQPVEGGQFSSVVDRRQAGRESDVDGIPEVTAPLPPPPVIADPRTSAHAPQRCGEGTPPPEGSAVHGPTTATGSQPATPAAITSGSDQAQTRTRILCPGVASLATTSVDRRRRGPGSTR